MPEFTTETRRLIDDAFHWVSNVSRRNAAASLLRLMLTVFLS